MSTDLHIVVEYILLQEPVLYWIDRCNLTEVNSYDLSPISTTNGPY